MAIVPGGWSPFEPLSAEDQKVFDQALKGFVGVHYTPKSVSKQVVAGVNYRFKCIASMPPSEVVWEAVVEVYAPLTGNPIVTGITRI